MNIKSKLPNVGTTIFTVMSSLAVQHNAINLGQGFPDFEMDLALPDLVCKAMKSGSNQYVHMNGLPALRKAIAEKAGKLYGCALDMDEEITVTPGATYCIFTAFATILQPDDEVIVFEPAYDCYIPAIELNGAKAITIQLSFPDYSIDWEKVREKVNDNTKAIIINSPHNPTGKVLSKEDLVQLQSITYGTNIFIISDEVYEHLIFDGKKHESLLGYPELYKRSFVCFSFGKTYHCTGWKIGYCIAPPMLTKEFRKIHQFNCFTTNSPVQYALAEYLSNEAAYLNLGSEMQQKRDFFMKKMKPSAFEPLPSHGSYFQLYSYKNISDEPEYDFAVRLVKEFGVATIPVSAFYTSAQNNQVVRFCFSKKESTLEAAASRLLKLK